MMEGNQDSNNSLGVTTDAVPFGYSNRTSIPIANEPPSPIPCSDEIPLRSNQQNQGHAAVSNTGTYSSVRNSLSETQNREYSVTNITIANANNFRIGHTYNNNYQGSKRIIPSEKDDSDASQAKPRNVRVPKGIFASNRPLEVQDMYVVAKKIGFDWRMLARRLPGNSFDDGILDALEHDYSKSLIEIVYQMLRQWKETQPQAATIGNLARTLFYDVDHPDIVTDMIP